MLPRKRRRPRAIVVDTREKQPFSFRGYRTISSTLSVGDYSVQGFESRVAVERKTGADLVNTVLTNRDRFIHELERASEYEAFAIVVETSLSSILFGVPTRTPLKTVVARLASLLSSARAPVLFADNRRMAEAVTLEVLRPYLDRAA